ncbi:TLC domain-containing protein 4-B-like [Argopecten irradians]|uniref:TLC domain-containing protein 4-B-like n=1 Tax=Argopecten irradians TaxID=31199 RepID=UPI00371F98C9
MSKTVHKLEHDFTYYPVAIFTFCFLWILYQKAFPVLSRKLSKSYTSLPSREQRQWNFRLVSSVHCSVVSLLCMYTLLFDEEIVLDPVWSDRPVVRISSAIVTGYTIADIFSMMINYEQNTKIFLFYLHHCVTIAANWCVFSFGIIPYFANYRTMSEFSVLFYNLKVFFQQTNMDRTSTLYTMNGCLFMFMFITARVLPIPRFWYMACYYFLYTDVTAALGTLRHLFVGIGLVLDILNITWGVQVMKVAHKNLTAAVQNIKSKLS